MVGIATQSLPLGLILADQTASYVFSPIGGEKHGVIQHSDNTEQISVFTETSNSSLKEKYENWKHGTCPIYSARFAKTCIPF